MFLNDPADTHFGHVDKWLDRAPVELAIEGKQDSALDGTNS
jgi:hypothetical protein